jgi:sugar phosphate isomerase/epimerase
MIDIACHTWSFHDLTLPEALGTIARLGFRAVDIGSGGGWNIANAIRDPRGAAAEIISDLRLFNLRLTDLYLMLPRISVENDEQRSKDVETFVGLLPFASALAAAMPVAPGITVSPGVAHKPPPDEPYDEAAFARSIESLDAMLAAARDFGLPVSIEPHPDSMAPTPDDAQRMLEALPGLKLTLDWANLVYSGATHEEVANLLPATRHIHIRQAARGQLQTAFDKGKIDLARMWSDLALFEYEGVVCVELIRLTGRHGVTTLNPHREAAQMRDALRAVRDRKGEPGKKPSL